MKFCDDWDNIPTLVDNVIPRQSMRELVMGVEPVDARFDVSDGVPILLPGCDDTQPMREVQP